MGFVPSTPEMWLELEPAKHIRVYRVETLYRFRPSVDSPSKPQWGSILLLVRALAPCSTPLL